MSKSRQVGIAGFMAAAVYLICAALAFFNYPLAFSPLTNWLSDLGNPIVNPRGAFLYNLGCVLTGLCLVFFTLGLDIWKKGDHKRRTLLRIAQATGILAALSLIVSALFPLGAQTFLHSISGKAHIFFTGFFLSFSATILLRHPITPKWIAYFGFLAAVVNFIYGAILYSVFIAEWVAIGLFILYVLIISANTLTQKTIVGMKFAR